MSTKIYAMKDTEDPEAETLLRRDIMEGMDASQFNNIIKLCCGIPLMLKLVARFIGYAPHKQDVYNTHAR